MKLLVDFGNTRLKWAVLDEGVLRPGGAFAPGDAPLAGVLTRQWAELGALRGVLVASVVGMARERELAELVRARFGVAAEFPRSPATGLGIRNAYPQPQHLGIDRFLGMAVLHARRARPQVLASVGTGLTLDLLDAGGGHRGGVIAPGLALMRESIQARAPRVTMAAGRWKEFPDNTADGVWTGTLLAVAGAVDRFLVLAERRLGHRPALVLTGGDAVELEPLLPGSERLGDLVLQGLAMLATAAASP